MDQDPDRTEEMQLPADPLTAGDEMGAALGALAAPAASFYRALREEGLPMADAAFLTGAVIWGGRGSGIRDDEEGEREH